MGCSPDRNGQVALEDPQDQRQSSTASEGRHSSAAEPPLERDRFKDNGTLANQHPDTDGQTRRGGKAPLGRAWRPAGAPAVRPLLPQWAPRVGGPSGLAHHGGTMALSPNPALPPEEMLSPAPSWEVRGHSTQNCGFPIKEHPELTGRADWSFQRPRSLRSTSWVPGPAPGSGNLAVKNTRPCPLRGGRLLGK